MQFLHFWEPYPTRLASDNPERRAAFAVEDPRLSTSPLVSGSARDVVSALSFFLELILALIGGAVVWRRSRTDAVWLLGVVLSFALGYALVFGKIRYRIPVLPIVFAFGGVGLAALVERLGRRQSDGSSRASLANSQK